MDTSKKSEIYELLDLIYPYAKDLETLMAIVCGIHDEDIKEFTDYLKNKKINDFHDILEQEITFRNLKRYKNDETEDK